MAIEQYGICLNGHLWGPLIGIHTCLRHGFEPQSPACKANTISIESPLGFSNNVDLMLWVNDKNEELFPSYPLLI